MVLAVAATAFTFSSLGMAAALAEGSWFEPTSTRFEAGETIELNAQVSRDGDGWVEDGPFFAYLNGETLGEITATAGNGATTDAALGELVVVASADSARVRLTATIPPATPAGEYKIVVCNDPCTSGLGDLMGGVLFVGMDPPDRGETGALAVIAPSPTTTLSLALAPHPSRSTGLSGAWVAVSAGLAAAVLAAAVLGRSPSD